MQQITINHKRQYGLSIIEIMIAITVSLLLISGIIQIFLSSKTSYNLQNGLGRLQENARFALDILSQDIGMAGYTTTLTALDPFSDVNTLDKESVNEDLGFIKAKGTASDVVEVTYTSVTDCLGNATGGKAIDRFFIEGNNLMCLGNGSAVAGVMAEGVENMQILYGDDSNNDGSANLYVNATNVTDWNRIVSVRVSLLLSTIEGVGKVDNTVTYAMLNSPPLGPFEGNSLRRVFTRTILLRNT